MGALTIIRTRIAETGPITVAEFMEIALYDPEHGYYAGAAQRSGRGGDFFTSVDVGPLFGELLAVQLQEMWRALGGGRFDLVEAAAGNGRLSRDILDAAVREFPEFYRHVRLTPVERSAAARAAQRATLAAHEPRLGDSLPDLPSRVIGAIVANELLDAFPVHVVVGTDREPREIFIDARGEILVEVERPLSTAARDELAVSGGRIPPGVRAELCPAARAWIAAAAAAIERGFLLLVDYGHEARELHSATHATGTLIAYRAHTAGLRHWLEDPGESDLTAHVNLTAVREAAERAGLRTLGMVDQTYFVLGLGLADRIGSGNDRGAIRRRLAARTLMMPGGLGSTMKVMIFARGVAIETLSGLRSGRLT